MKEYEQKINIVIDDELIPARLKVLRLPGSWFGVAWVNKLHHATFGLDHVRANAGGGIESLSDNDFLRLVQRIAALSVGCDFEYERAH